ncbi:hypothetical protein M0R45_027058 [Rubus argutus]|uniref:Uncharacterized protein n=1 Tax=Rubus argutus TaxID=59490 RepID=A0AAW1WZZ2_RUBAR
MRDGSASWSGQWRWRRLGLDSEQIDGVGRGGWAVAVATDRTGPEREDDALGCAELAVVRLIWFSADCGFVMVRLWTKHGQEEIGKKEEEIRMIMELFGGEGMGVWVFGGG